MHTLFYFDMSDILMIDEKPAWNKITVDPPPNKKRKEKAKTVVIHRDKCLSKILVKMSSKFYVYSLYS